MCMLFYVDVLLEFVFGIAVCGVSCVYGEENFTVINSIF